MHLMLSESQRERHGGLRWFVEEAVVPVAGSLQHAARYPAEVVIRVAELRLFGIPIPQEYGGLEQIAFGCTVSSQDTGCPPEPALA